MNKKIKKTLLGLAILLLSIFPVRIRLYATDYDGIISKLKPGDSSDSKINEIGSEILRIHTMDWCCIFICSNNDSGYNGSYINNC